VRQWAAKSREKAASRRHMSRRPGRAVSGSFGSDGNQRIRPAKEQKSKSPRSGPSAASGQRTTGRFSPSGRRPARFGAAHGSRRAARCQNTRRGITRASASPAGRTAFTPNRNVGQGGPGREKPGTRRRCRSPPARALSPRRQPTRPLLGKEVPSPSTRRRAMAIAGGCGGWRGGPPVSPRTRSSRGVHRGQSFTRRLHRRTR